MKLIIDIEANMTQPERPWRTDTPPDGVWVEVACMFGNMLAMWHDGHKGIRPHWRDKKGTWYAFKAFKKWRHLEQPE